MECPACHRELTTMTVGGVKLDVCKDGCAGIWFNAFELKKFDEPNEFAVGQVQVDVVQDGLRIARVAVADSGQSQHARVAPRVGR